MAKMKASVKNGMQGRKIKRSPADQAVQVLIYLFIASFALITLLPFLYVIAGSFATECKLRSNGMPVPLLRNCYSIFNGTKYR